MINAPTIETGYEISKERYGLKYSYLILIIFKRIYLIHKQNMYYQCVSEYDNEQMTPYSDLQN